MAQLPGTEIVPYLLAQPAPDGLSQPWGGFAAANPDEQSANEQRMRNWILRDGNDGGVQPQPAQVERRGFFRRLFGG